MRSFQGTAWDPVARRWVEPTPEVIERRALYQAGQLPRAPLRVAMVYPHRFKPDLIEAVLKAAAPIPASRFRWKDPRTKKIRTCLRSDAVIHRLELIAASAELRKSDLSPSVLRNQLRAITAAADKLAKILRKSLGDKPVPQIQHALWAVAEDDGAADPDHRLQEILDGAEQIRGWSRSAEEIARKRIGIAPPNDRTGISRSMH
jgi:hypothetical protein